MLGQYSLQFAKGWGWNTVTCNLKCVLAMGGLCSEKHSTNGTWLFSLTDLGQPLQCFKKNRQRRKVSSNQEEVSDHGGSYNKQSHIPSCQKHFLKDISFQYIRRNWSCLQIDLPWLFLFNPGTAKWFLSWFHCQCSWELQGCRIGPLLACSWSSNCAVSLPRCLFFFIHVNTKNA